MEGENEADVPKEERSRREGGRMRGIRKWNGDRIKERNTYLRFTGSAMHCPAAQ
jgi:hypothetical protein